MENRISFERARNTLLEIVKPVEREIVPLASCTGRIIGQMVIAQENIPPFDRSPYDGYAFRSIDSRDASAEHPVTLRVLEEIPAGSFSHVSVTEGCAVKIMTGAAIPKGADAVVKYELTEFTEASVSLFQFYPSGSNIVKSGEDVKKGDPLAEKGTLIDPGLMGTLASQNIPNPQVYRIPRIGIISTGNELIQLGEEREPGKIYNSNQYMLSSAVEKCGCCPVILGSVKDCVEDICALIVKGLDICDLVLVTGGVSVGDYDLTPDAMKRAGVEILCQGVDLKPGMACAYGVKDGKLVCGLSGNPASAITNFYTIVWPVIRKLCGYKDFSIPEIRVRLKNGFPKPNKCTRILRGKLDLSGGTVYMEIPNEQGNVVLSSMIGCDVMAIVPPGGGPVEADTELKGFLI